MTTSDKTPYRLIVFYAGFAAVRRTKKHTEIAPRLYAFMAWTDRQYFQEARLPSAGSFLFPGIHAVRAETMKYLAMPHVEQVSVRTNQDRQVYRYFRRADGSVSGYGGCDGL